MRDLLVGVVHMERAVVEGGHWVVPGDLAAADGLEPGQELDPAEGLGQVVVRSRVEAAHLVSFGTQSREHENWYVAHVPDALENLPSVQVRQADVEHDDVGVALVELADSVAPFRRLRHCKPFPLEQGPQQLTDIGLVFDDKY